MVDVRTINLDRSPKELRRLMNNAMTGDLPDEEKTILIQRIEKELGINPAHQALLEDMKAGAADISDIKI